MNACGHGYMRARMHERMFACKCMFACAGVRFSCVGGWVDGWVDEWVLSGMHRCVDCLCIVYVTRVCVRTFK